MLYVLPFVLALAGLAAGQQNPPPKPQTSTPPAQAVQRPAARPAPPPFAEKADAKSVISAAVASAAIDDIRVLVAWGANDDKGSTQFIV